MAFMRGRIDAAGGDPAASHPTAADSRPQREPPCNPGKLIHSHFWPGIDVCFVICLHAHTHTPQTILQITLIAINA